MTRTIEVRTPKQILEQPLPHELMHELSQVLPGVSNSLWLCLRPLHEMLWHGHEAVLVSPSTYEEAYKRIECGLRCMGNTFPHGVSIRRISVTRHASKKLGAELERLRAAMDGAGGGKSVYDVTYAWATQTLMVARLHSGIKDRVVVIQRLAEAVHRQVQRDLGWPDDLRGQLAPLRRWLRRYLRNVELVDWVLLHFAQGVASAVATVMAEHVERDSAPYSQEYLLNAHRFGIPLICWPTGTLLSEVVYLVG
ncbi:hypothetical protein HY375_00220 [Candidatus Berkelbacteria bacterium]|nr:hypothetical protein [Candidatus Berkelbacteria bacterium]